jgi:alkylhydroperoxidase/carboxymuconolactone decarboxylase family protein YurZ
LYPLLIPFPQEFPMSLSLAPNIAPALSAFTEAARADTPPNLEPRDQVLVRYAVALARNDRDQANAARRDAVEVGITGPELGHIAALVLAFEVARLERLGSSSCCG